jgi:seryl-tRNA synthetase
MTEISNNLISRAEAAHWVYTLQNTPLMVFRTPMTRLITAIRQILIDDVAVSSGFEEWIFPRMVPEEVLAKTGWLKYHREEAWLVDPKREFVFEPDQCGLFPRKTLFPSDPLPYALDPIQCVSLYYALFGRTIDMNELPMKIFEYQGGWTHRYETNPDGLRRGFEFLRLEFVWVALMNEAISLRNELLKKTVDTLSEQLVLDIEVAEGDSCFEAPPTSEYAKDSIFPSSQVSRLDASASVDVITRDQGGEPLEIVSAGRHDSLPRRFEIEVTKPDGTVTNPWSGCLGIGLTRLALAFLSKHDFDPSKWPPRPKRIFGETIARH